MGIVHGGIFADLADAAMGIAFVSTLEEGEAFSTIELKMNYFRPVKEGRLVARRPGGQRRADGGLRGGDRGG